MMITTQEEQARVYKAVEAVLKAKTGAYRGMEQSRASQTHGSDANEHHTTQDAA
jgi:hypothetical protein